MKNARPTDKDLRYYVIDNYAPSWKEIGILLQLPTAKLLIIEANHPHDCVRQCISMFQIWQQIDVNATWKKLIEVLDEVDGKVYIHMHVYICMCTCINIYS